MVLFEELKMTDGGLRDRIDTILDAPAELLLPERIVLYALVRGLAPRRCLEIGSHFGGSTTIIGAALDDGGGGTLTCVDPNPLIPPAVWANVAHRAKMLRGLSPAALVAARVHAGDDFDFVFIDGDHTRDGVIRDVEGVLGVAAPGAHLIFHDAHYWEVSAAIDECLRRHGNLLVDCGMISTASTDEIAGARWGGLRMLRVAATRDGRMS